MGASLLVIDDDAAVRGFLADNLREDGSEVSVAGDVGEAVGALRRGRADIALIDLGLPDQSGLELVRMVREGDAGPVDTGLIVVSGRGAEQDRIRAFQRGVDDYVVKPVSYPELLLRINALHARMQGRLGTSIEVGPIVIDLAARSVVAEGVPVPLPGKEYELLVALARDPMRVHHKEDLMERVWGYRNCGTRTLDSHASRLRRRLTRAADGPWVINNWGVGYSLTAVR